MLNYIWAGLFLIGLLVAGVLGRYDGDQGVITQALSMAKVAVMDIALPLAGMMMFWLGIMRLMERAGLLALLARALHPIMRRLFPQVPRDHPALSAMIMNLAANMLGLGNSATPLGLKAMEHLQELNPHKRTATNAMVTFLALNTAAFTLVPMTAINYLAAAGVPNAYRVIVPTILATACTTLTAILMAKGLERLARFRIRPEEEKSEEGSGKESEGKSGMLGRGKILLGVLLASFAGITVLELADPSLRQSVLDRTGISSLMQAAERPSVAGASTADAASVSGLDAASGIDWKAKLNSLSALAIPLLLVITLGVALARRVKVYEEFVDGAKEGFSVATRIMPFLVAMFAALAVFRYSGALKLLEFALGPALRALGFPPELLPMALMRPLSGSGSL
ncbi:MAG: nucleoside recognition protein, partial [Verrucomicrobiales bacterium]|nr:nucleoside recognition protein [Verrucomicrobiales bacterium]